MTTQRYFIVNPAGCIHEVDQEHAERRLKIAGWRLATAAEVALLNSPRRDMAPGEQRDSFPICKPFDISAE